MTPECWWLVYDERVRMGPNLKLTINMHLPDIEIAIQSCTMCMLQLISNFN